MPETLFDKLLGVIQDEIEEGSLSQEDVESIVSDMDLEGSGWSESELISLIAQHSAVGTIDENTAVVSDASNLQSAVDNYGTVWISGRLDVDDYAPIVVPEETCIMGFGRYRETDWMSHNSIVVDGTDGPTFHLEGNHPRMFGVGVRHNSSDGEAIYVTGYTANLSHLSVFSNGHGIRIGSESDNVPTECRVNFSRIVSESGLGSETRGIWVEQQYDAKLTDNMVAGFDISIEVNEASAYIAGSHTYAHPADGYSMGIRSTSYNHRVMGNRIEGAPVECGMEFTRPIGSNVVSNLCQVGEDADGIRLTDDIEISIFAFNQLFRNGISWSRDKSLADTAITGDSDVYNSQLFGNIAEGFDDSGLAGENIND